MKLDTPIRYGKLITFEGLDCSGKTTLIESLAKYLWRHKSLYLAKEPGNHWLGRKLYNLMTRKGLDFICPKAELALFLAARAQTIAMQMNDLLANDIIILCHRFHDSTIAYQGAHESIGYEAAKTACELFAGDLMPDLTIYLHLPMDVFQQRLDAKEHRDELELRNIEYFTKVKELFDRQAQEEPERIFTIDATLPPGEVLNLAMHKINECILGKGIQDQLDEKA